MILHSVAGGTPARLDKEVAAFVAMLRSATVLRSEDTCVEESGWVPLVRRSSTLFVLPLQRKGPEDSGYGARSSGGQRSAAALISFGARGTAAGFAYTEQKTAITARPEKTDGRPFSYVGSSTLFSTLVLFAPLLWFCSLRARCRCERSAATLYAASCRPLESADARQSVAL